MNEKNVSEISEEMLKKKKLQLEIAELKKPWYMKPAFLVPIIGTISTLIMLYITGFFDVRFAELRIQKENLVDENRNLEDKKEDLTRKTEALGIDKDSLEKQKNNLLNEQIKLEKRRDELKQSNLQLTNKKRELEYLERKLTAINDSLINENKIVLERLNNANRPVLIFSHNDNFTNQIDELVLENSGLGPAYIKQVTFFIDGKEYRTNNLKTILSKLDINHFWMYYFNMVSYPEDKDKQKRYVLYPSKSIQLFKVEENSYKSSYRDRFNEALNRLSIEIEYCNSNGDCFIGSFHK